LANPLLELVELERAELRTLLTEPLSQPGQVAGQALVDFSFHHP
jgi:hypothetical protein